MTVDANEYESLLRDLKIELAPPLSDEELHRIERRFEISFGVDHAAMLQGAVPVGPKWPDWRADDDRALRASLAWPIEGVLFDIENNAFWLDHWGARPARTRDAVETARVHLLEWPQPVPIYSHRYMTEGAATGAPVLSIYQTDVIVYGIHLFDYLWQEFGSQERLPGGPTDNHRTIPDPWFALVDA